MKPSLFLLMATSCLVLTLTATAETPALLRTFNNPSPTAGDNFGAGIAALGGDHVLVGAPYDDTTATNAGVVYLFHTNGTLLTTFTNPNPANSFFDADLFGSAIAALGSERVLVGSPNERAVYLFATNGILVHTIDSVNFPEDISFGAAVAAFGTDGVLIGAPGYTLDPDFTDYAGAAYLYGTNGALLATFSNPENQAYDEFGFSVAAFGNDRVLIGSRSIGPGAAYLFSTNGTLLKTFTNPTPANFDYFGHSVAAAGADRVLVGAYQDDTVTTNAGAVYLFTTNGTLLLTITNPTPAVGDNFGNRLAMLGNDRVVIGAPGDDTTGADAGSAYLFSINGTLLATFNNPTPATWDRFGYRLAAFGSESAIIAALDDTGAADAGSAYLFSVPASAVAPSLAIQLTSSNTVAISWPSPSTGFVLQQNTNELGSMNWSNVPDTMQDSGTVKSISFSPGPGSCFYRLFKP